MKDSYSLTDDSGRIVAMAFMSPDFNMGRRERWFLNRIVVRDIADRGKGYGSRLLDTICAEADAEGVDLLLGVEPDPFMPKVLNYRQLASWYRSRGFRRLKGNVMIRHPKKRGGTRNEAAKAAEATSAREG